MHITSCLSCQSFRSSYVEKWWSCSCFAQTLKITLFITRFHAQSLRWEWLSATTPNMSTITVKLTKLKSFGCILGSIDCGGHLSLTFLYTGRYWQGSETRFLECWCLLFASLSLFTSGVWTNWGCCSWNRTATLGTWRRTWTERCTRLNGRWRSRNFRRTSKPCEKNCFCWWEPKNRCHCSFTERKQTTVDGFMTRFYWKRSESCFGLPKHP